MPDRRGYTSALVQNDVTSLLAKAALGMKADEAPKFLDTTHVQGTMEMGRRMEPDLRVPSGLVPYAFSSTVAAGGAGQNASAAVLCPAGFLCVVEGFEINLAAVATINWSITTATMGGGGAGALQTDPRNLKATAGVAPPFTPAPNFVVVNQAGTTPPAGSSRIYKSAAPLNVLHTLPFPVVLSTGYGIIAINNDDDAGIDCNIWGYIIQLNA